MWLSDAQKIGIALVAFGIFFQFLGIVLLFDGPLLALGNILFLSGLPLIIGPTKTFYFFSRKEKWRGTLCFFGGILIRVGWERTDIKASGVHQTGVVYRLEERGVTLRDVALSRVKLEHAGKKLGHSRRQSSAHIESRVQGRKRVQQDGSHEMAEKPLTQHSVLVFCKWPVSGILIEFVGFVGLFGSFFPVILQALRQTPIIGTFLCLPYVRQIADRLAGVRQSAV